MKDIILINLPTNAWYKKEFSKNNAMPPLGLMYIATVLQNNHFDVDLIDFSVTNIVSDFMSCHQIAHIS
ncbi:hypothetical protein [Blautia massiliensis (ex Durand et al. 2017)]|uniref:hypothetical protein n=1 Tax=Blautia massiliensis (ex Durand et al. 2017) TaxID=1737424 RepID=UPI0039A29744